MVSFFEGPRSRSTQAADMHPHQAADMAVWARGSSAEGSDAGVATLRGCASSDSATFRAAYLRGAVRWMKSGTLERRVQWKR